MAEPAVYLEKLSAFSRILRMEGLSVSPKETEDASRLLISLGLEDRQRVKTALRTVYAKSREEQISFDRAFDGFFISEEAMRRQAREQMERAKELLREGVLTITAVANATGFSSVHYFSRTFKSVVGMSPREYIRSVRSMADRPAAVTYQDIYTPED